MGRLMKRFHRHTQKRTQRHRDPRQWTSLWSFKRTRGSRRVRRPTHHAVLAGNSRSLSFLLFFFSRWFFIFPPSFFCNCLPPSLPPSFPFLSLSLSYTTNCCWSSVFCVAREIFQYALQRTMPCLSCEQRRLGRHAMNNADFSIDSLYAIESCFMLWDLIFTLTWHTVFTDVLLPCMINATVQRVSAGTGSTKTFPLYRLFLQLWPVKSQWRDRMRDRTSSHCCEEVESSINRCQRHCTASGWPVTTTECVVLLSFPDPDTSWYAHCCSGQGSECLWTRRPARVSPSTTNDAPLK